MLKRFEEIKLTKVVLATLLVAAGVFGTEQLGLWLSMNTSGGEYAGLGVAILFFYIILVAGPLALAIAYYSFKIPHWLTLAVMSSATFIAIQSLSSFIFYGLPWQVVLLAELSLVLAIPPAQAWILNIQSVKLLARIILAALFGAMVVGGLYAVGLYLNSKVEAKLNNEQQKIIQEYPFKVFVPHYTAKNYHMDIVGNQDLGDPTEADGAHYYSIDYLVGSNDLGAPTPYHINSFKKPKSYNPPSICGTDEPEYYPTRGLSYPCRQVGMSKFGSPIYYTDGDLSNSNVLYWHVVIGNTEVVVTTIMGEPNISIEDAIKIIDSLEPKTASELKQY